MINNYFTWYIVWPYKDFINGVKNIFNFFKVIWQWRSWDYSYTLALLKTTLELHKKGIEKHSLSKYKEENELAILSELLDILNRMIEDDYGDIVGVQYDNMQFDFKPIGKIIDDGEEGYELIHSFENGYTQEQHDKLRDKADEMQKQDIKRFGELMSKIEYIWY